MMLELVEITVRDGQEAEFEAALRGPAAGVHVPRLPGLHRLAEHGGPVRVPGPGALGASGGTGLLLVVPVRPVLGAGRTLPGRAAPRGPLPRASGPRPQRAGCDHRPGMDDRVKPGARFRARIRGMPRLTS